MLEGDLLFSLISLAAGALCLCLGIYVSWKNPYLTVSRVLTVTLFLAAIDAVSLFLLANAPDEGTALLFGRVVLFVSVLVGGSFCYLSYCFPYERPDGWPVRNKNLFIALIVILALIPALLFDSVYRDRFGYWLDYSLYLYIWLLLVIVLSILPVIALTQVCLRSTSKTVRWQIALVSLGVTFPILSIVLDEILYEVQIFTPHIPAVGLLLTGCLFSYAILGHKIFLIEPVKEDRLEAEAAKDPGIKLANGHCDLIESKKADLSYRMFVAEVAAGSKGLLITRVHPDQVREKFGLVKTPILWLSSQPGPDRVDPASLSILQHTVVDFLQKGPSSIILLDGLEYLVSENQVEKVLRFVYTVHDAVVISSSKFIVPIDPDILNKKELALFEKEFDVMRTEEGAGSEI